MSRSPPVKLTSDGECPFLPSGSEWYDPTVRAFAISLVSVFCACASAPPARSPDPVTTPAAAPSASPTDGAHEGHDEHGHGHHGHGHGHHGPDGAPHHASGMHHRFENAEQWAKMFDDPARDAWQQPDRVIAELDLTPAMTVADVGAGTGYFAVRIARHVPQGEVIATDLEADMVRYLTERAQREKLPNLRAQRATADDAGLAQGSVDRILVVDVWHHLGDRVAYARSLARALRPGGKLVIVDFRLDSERGPPKQHRLAPEAIVADLRAAGLDAKLSPTTLPDQYIVTATRTGA